MSKTSQRRRIRHAAEKSWEGIFRRWMNGRCRLRSRGNGDNLAAGRRGTREGTMANGTKAGGGWSWWYLLFVIEFVLILWPPLYNSVEPSLIGIPFFYWYQLLVVVIGAVLTAIVYFATREKLGTD